MYNQSLATLIYLHVYTVKQNVCVSMQRNKDCKQTFLISFHGKVIVLSVTSNHTCPLIQWSVNKWSHLSFYTVQIIIQGQTIQETKRTTKKSKQQKIKKTVTLATNVQKTSWHWAPMRSSRKQNSPSSVRQVELFDRFDLLDWSEHVEVCVSELVSDSLSPSLSSTSVSTPSSKSTQHSLGRVQIRKDCSKVSLVSLLYSSKIF